MDLLSSLNGLNARVNKLNANRNVQLGKKEQLEKQLEKAKLEYKEKFGVDLTEVDINIEYTSVLTATQESASFLEQVLQAVESGDYATAEGLLQRSLGTEDSSNEHEKIESDNKEPLDVHLATADMMLDGQLGYNSGRTPVNFNIPYGESVDESINATEVQINSSKVPEVNLNTPPVNELQPEVPSVPSTVPVMTSRVQTEVPDVANVEQHIEVEQKSTPRLKSRLQSTSSSGVTPPAPSVNKSASGGFKFVPSAPLNVGVESEDETPEEDSDSSVPSFNGLLRGTAFQPNGGS